MHPRALLRYVRLGEDRVRQLLHLRESPQRLERDAQKFWSRPVTQDNSFWWHTRGAGVYSDVQWQRIGQKHVELFRRQLMPEGRIGKMIDWGCGGGANAAEFCRIADHLWGVEVSADSLAACAQQVERTLAGDQLPPCRFVPHQIEVSQPESALQAIPNDLDFFFCVYVFQVFPTQEYGRRILKLAHRLLKAGGTAMIQIRYATGSWTTRSRRWGYTRGTASMTTWAIDEFWVVCEQEGFIPHAVYVVPQSSEVPSDRFAYYFLTKPG